jgi:hypothetical protein
MMSLKRLDRLNPEELRLINCCEALFQKSSYVFEVKLLREWTVDFIHDWGAYIPPGTGASKGSLQGAPSFKAVDKS